jgi:hypothetical protein
MNDFLTADSFGQISRCGVASRWLLSSGKGVCRRAHAFFDKVQFIKSFPIQVKKVPLGCRMSEWGVCGSQKPIE